MSGEKWIAVIKRLPENGQHVIIHDMICGIGEAVYYLTTSGSSLWTDPIEEYFTYNNVTHWLALPEAPKENER